VICFVAAQPDSMIQAGCSCDYCGGCLWPRGGALVYRWRHTIRRHWAMMGEASRRSPGTSQLIGNRTERENHASGNCRRVRRADRARSNKFNRIRLVESDRMGRRDSEDVGNGARFNDGRSCVSSTAARLRRMSSERSATDGKLVVIEGSGRFADELSRPGAMVSL